MTTPMRYSKKINIYTAALVSELRLGFLFQYAPWRPCRMALESHLNAIFFGDCTNWLITFCCAAAACVHDDMDAEFDWTDKQTDG